MEEKQQISNRKIITKEELLKMNEVNKEGTAKQFSSSSFQYYTTRSTLDKIIPDNKAKHYIYINNLKNMNDIDEAELHTQAADIYAFCLCNSKSEGIPMWYMYSGTDGKGACIRFTPGGLLMLIRNNRYLYPVLDNRPDINNPLEIDHDFTMQIGWIYYADENGDLYFKNKWYHLHEQYKDFAKDNYFIKKYPWHYEREFRIAFKINRAHDEQQRYALEIPENILRQATIWYGPEAELKSMASRYLANYKTQHSKLKIKMRLSERR